MNMEVVLKRILLTLAILSLVVGGISATAFAAKGNPHQEEQDGCDHGHTGKPCRPDPQPSHGKDCLVHGKHGGINEDHCSTATTTSPPITTTTIFSTTTTTTASVATTTTQPPIVTTTTQPSVTNTTQSTPTVVTTVTMAPASGEIGSTANISSPTPATSSPIAPIPTLPHTGSPNELLTGIGFLSIGLGNAMRYLFKNKK